MQETIFNTNTHAVLDVLRQTEQHPTALEVYNTVRQVRPHIGLATVYRILHQLVEQRLIKELRCGAESCRYDAHIQRHDHAICVVCGVLLDIPMDVRVPTEALRGAAQAAKLELTSHEVRIYGRCINCQQNNGLSKE